MLAAGSHAWLNGQRLALVVLLPVKGWLCN